MKTKITSVCRALAACLVISAATAVAGGAKIVSPKANFHGKSYAEWSAVWWQWAISLPVEGHPSLDETGADAYAGQSGPVFFLTGVFNASGTVERHITIPHQKALFIPVLNADCSNVEPPPFYGATEADMRAGVIGLMNDTSGQFIEIDGQVSTDLSRFRFDSPLFSFTLPDPNILGVAGGGPGSAVADGYYVMLHPLQKGEHTIRFGGTFDAYGLTLNITYHVTVE